MSKKTIAIDFDGVIHKYSQGWKDGAVYDEPIEFAFDTINQLLKEFNVFILSTRNSKQIEEWLIKWGAPFKFEIIEGDSIFWNKDGVVGITNRKLAAMAYIDDRAYYFQTWTDVVYEMRERLKHEN